MKTYKDILEMIIKISGNHGPCLPLEYGCECCSHKTGCFLCFKAIEMFGNAGDYN